MDDEYIVNEHRFKAINKGLTMIVTKLYELECRIALLEKRRETSVNRLKIDFTIKNNAKLPEKQTKL